MVTAKMRVPELAWIAVVLCAGLGSFGGFTASAGWRELAGYILSLPPAGGHLAANAVASAAGVVFGILLLGGCAAAGRRLVRLAASGAGGRPTSLVAVFAGYAALSQALLGLAALGLWYPAVLTVFLGLFLAFGLPEYRSLSREWADGIAATLADFPLLGRLGLAVAAVLLVPLLLVPETNLDCYQYHLAFPQQLLQTHRLFGREIYLAWAYPLLADLPNVFPVMLRMDIAVRFFHPVMAYLGVLVFVRALGIRLTPAREAGVILTALAVPVPAFCLLSAKNDPVVAGYALACAGLFLSAGLFSRKTVRKADVLLAGVLCGALAASKYVMLPFAAALAAVAVFRLWHRVRVPATLLLAAGAALALGPWMVRSWIYLNDPLYPIGSIKLPRLFGDGSTNANTAALYGIFLQETRPKAAAPIETILIAVRNCFPLLAAAPALAAACRAATGWFMGAVFLGLFGMILEIRGGLDFVERFTYPVLILFNAAAGAFIFREREGSPAGGEGRGAWILVVGWVFFGVAGGLGAARTAARSLEFKPGVSPADYVSGRKGVEEYRTAGLNAYGAVLPAVWKAMAGNQAGRVLSVGETMAWDIPARVIETYLEPPFVWKAVNETATEERLTLKFRQAGVRWLIYNAPVAGYSRFVYSPYEWNTRMLGLYSGYARRHFRLLASSGRTDPNYGCDWLYAVSDTPSRPAQRMLFLPGTERAFSYAALAELHAAYVDAILRFRDVRRKMPAVVWPDALLGHSLMLAGRWREAYPLVKGSVKEGLLDEFNLLDWAVSAAKLGKREEAAEALRLAESAYPLWPERVAEARKAAGF